MPQATNAGGNVPSSALLAVNSAPVQVTRHTRLGLLGNILGYYGGPAPDTTRPVITIVSPTPGAIPGAAGGFPADLYSARQTEIVTQITDVTSGGTPEGLAAVIVTATFLNYPSVGRQVREVIYMRGQFVGNYIAGSSQKTITNGIELHCRRVDGWPAGSNTLGDIVFSVDAIDKAGNLT